MSETQEQYGNPSGMSEGKQMTAVEWLEDVYNTQGRILPQQFEQAKAMEKEQIIDAYNDGSYAYGMGIKEPEQYYNETFGKP